MRSIKAYFEILRKKGLYMCLREAKKAIWPIWWTHSRAAIEQIQAERASRYLWRHYKDLIVKPLDEGMQSNEPTRIIWMCWLQGLDNAPEIVKKCVASVKQNMPNYEFRLLTAENMFEYVTLPEHIVRKYKNGTISFTHFSDILRTALLVQHGGIWIDATVLMTGSISAKFADLPLFFLQQSKMQVSPHFGSSWFLIARKGNPILLRVLELLSDYWKQEDLLRDYYLFHLFVYLVFMRNQQGNAIWRTIPHIPNVDAHTFRAFLFDDFEEEQWLILIKRSPIHKLSWKFIPSDSLDKKGTYYDYILHHLHL